MSHVHLVNVVSIVLYFASCLYSIKAYDYVNVRSFIIVLCINNMIYPCLVFVDTRHRFTPMDTNYTVDSEIHGSNAMSFFAQTGNSNTTLLSFYH